VEPNSNQIDPPYSRSRYDLASRLCARPQRLHIFSPSNDEALGTLDGQSVARCGGLLYVFLRGDAAIAA